MKYIALLFILLFTLPLSAQITEQKAFISAGSGETVMTISVKEKKTNLPMTGASVFLSCKQDTLKTVTNDYGSAFFNDIPYQLDKDTLHVNLSFMGYRSLEYSYVHKPFIRLTEVSPKMTETVTVRTLLRLPPSLNGSRRPQMENRPSSLSPLPMRNRSLTLCP